MDRQIDKGKGVKKVTGSLSSRHGNATQNDLKYMDNKLNNETKNVRKIFRLRNADPD
jgi:hypothetical protein